MISIPKPQQKIYTKEKNKAKQNQNNKKKRHQILISSILTII